jgi:hypothetical protein
MGWELIVSGDAEHLSDAAAYENQIAEGQRGKLDLNFSVPVPTADVNSLRNSLAWSGVEDLEVVSSGNKVTIYYRKGFAWLPVIIVAVSAALVAIFIYLTIWTLSKEVSGSVLSIGVIGAAALAFGVAYFLFRKQY